MAKQLGNMKMSIEGLEELKDTLNQLAPREAQNILRGTVHGVAGEVRKAMRRRAPKDEGDLRKAIFVQRRRGRPGEVISEVRIRHGKGQKPDAYYWHIIEFGAVNVPAQPYIVPTIQEMKPQIPRIFREQFGKKFEKAMVRKAKRAAKQAQNG